MYHDMAMYRYIVASLIDIHRNSTRKRLGLKHVAVQHHRLTLERKIRFIN